MPSCASCGQDNPEGFRFCGRSTAPSGELAEAQNLVGMFSTWRGSMQAGQEAYERAAQLAKRYGNARVLAQNSWWRLTNALWGPTTVEEALELCRRIRNETDSRLTAAAVAYVEGAFILMRDDANEAALEQGGGRRRFRGAGPARLSGIQPQGCCGCVPVHG